jgi:Fe(3+) dicitrate transport protein
MNLQQQQYLLCLAWLTLALAAPAAAQEPPPPSTPTRPAPAEEKKTLTREELEALLEEGETIDVVGKVVDVSRVGGSAQVVDEEALERFEYDDINRVLKQVPGVYLREEDGFGLRPNIGLRGALSDRSSKVTLMEDGVLLGPAPYSAPAAYYFPLVTRMTAMEVFKGPASIKHGPQTVGGAINLRTRAVPEGLQSELDLAAGLFRTGKVHGSAGWGGKHVGVLLEGVRLRTDGFKQLDSGGETGFDKSELMLKGYLQSDDSQRPFQRLELKVGYSDERSYETYLGLTDADFAANPWRRYAASQRDRMDWQRLQLQLSHLLNLGPELEVRTQAYRHTFARTWYRLDSFRGAPPLLDILRNPSVGEAGIYTGLLRGELDSSESREALIMASNARGFVSQGVQSVARWRPEQTGPLSHSVEVGARLHYDSIERFHLHEGFFMRSGTLVADGLPSRVAVHNKASTLALALHAHDEIMVGGLVVAPGVRMELISGKLRDRNTDRTQEDTELVLLPGIGAVYQVTSALGLLAGVHQGFSPKSPGQAAEVRSERSLNYEAGARYQSDSLRAELVGFFNDYTNLTGECTFSSGCSDELINQQFNGGRVHVYGLEAGAGAQVQGPAGLTLRADLTYTLTLSRFLTSFESGNPQFGRVTAGDELPYVPVHQGQVGAGVEAERWAANLSLSLVGAMREQAGQGPLAPGMATDAFAVVDLAGSYRVSDSGRVYLTASNLLDSVYIIARRPFGARPGAPRMAQLGYKLQF